MKKYDTAIDYQATKELTRSNMIIYQSFTLLGVLGILGYILLGIYVVDFSTFWNVLILMLSVVLFVFGLLYCYLIHRTRNKAKNVTIKLHYEFHDLFVVISSNETNSKPMKVNYSDIRYYKSSPNYIFLYLSIANAFPLLKSNELEEIKKIIHLDKIKKKIM